jgi:anti-sigma regulatory factor (Ser/Thr protein kinase)
MQGAPSRLQVRLAADAASVPAVRRFVADGLAAWGEAKLVDAAELVASELSSNAALHAMAQFMHVTLERASDDAAGVRVAVEDDGPVGVEAVLPRTPGGADLDVDELDATGRGLAIVAMLAGRWGVDVTRRGKRVWAELVDPDPEHEALDPVRDETDAASPPGDLPPGWVLVRLVQCPVALSLRQDSHLDELVRELQLLSVDGPNHESAAIAEEIQGLLASPTHARIAGRRAAEQARDDHLEAVDVDLARPREVGLLAEQLHRAVARADRLCEEGRLLTVASPPELREVRAWMTHEVTEQAIRGAAPTSWPDWLKAAIPPDHEG